MSRSWIGYGGAISGNFFTWGKDNLTWGGVLGEGIGNYISSMGAGAVATNFGGALVQVLGKLKDENKARDRARIRRAGGSDNERR